MSVSNKYKIEYKICKNEHLINIKKLNLCLYINIIYPSLSFVSEYKRGWVTYKIINNVLIEDTLASMLKSKNHDDLNLAFEILNTRFLK